MPVKKCTCVSEFQDKTYGEGMRYMNEKASKQGDKKPCTCTVCGKVH